MATSGPQKWFTGLADARHSKRGVVSPRCLAGARHSKCVVVLARVPTTPRCLAGARHSTTVLFQYINCLCTDSLIRAGNFGKPLRGNGGSKKITVWTGHFVGSQTFIWDNKKILFAQTIVWDPTSTPVQTDIFSEPPLPRSGLPKLATRR